MISLRGSSIGSPVLYCNKYFTFCVVLDGNGMYVFHIGIGYSLGGTGVSAHREKKG